MTSDYTKIETENDKKINFNFKINSEIINNNIKLNCSNDSQEVLSRNSKDFFKSTNFSSREKNVKNNFNLIYKFIFFLLIKKFIFLKVNFYLKNPFNTCYKSEYSNNTNNNYKNKNYSNHNNQNNKLNDEEKQLSKSYVQLLKEKNFEISKLKCELIDLKNKIKQSGCTDLDINTNLIENKLSYTNRPKSTTNKIFSNSIFKFNSNKFPFDNKIEILSENKKNINDFNDKNTVNIENNSNGFKNNKHKKFSATFSNFFRKSNNKKLNSNNISDNYSMLKDFIKTNYTSSNGFDSINNSN